MRGLNTGSFSLKPIVLSSIYGWQLPVLQWPTSYQRLPFAAEFTTPQHLKVHFEVEQNNALFFLDGSFNFHNDCFTVNTHRKATFNGLHCLRYRPQIYTLSNLKTNPPSLHFFPTWTNFVQKVCTQTVILLQMDTQIVLEKFIVFNNFFDTKGFTQNLQLLQSVETSTIQNYYIWMVLVLSSETR